MTIINLDTSVSVVIPITKIVKDSISEIEKERIIDSLKVIFLQCRGIKIDPCIKQKEDQYLLSFKLRTEYLSNIDLILAGIFENIGRTDLVMGGVKVGVTN